jgi:N-acetylneuraminic acid mutarotase
MPSEIEWKKLNQKGDQPSARSGHTLTWVGGKNYMLYGGIEETVDTHNKDGGPQRKIGPNEDIYFMKLVNNDCTWVKEKATSSEHPLPRSQHVAITIPGATAPEKVFIFGGHHSPKCRLNDTWFFKIKELEWERIGNDPDNSENEASTIGAPAPRANMGSCIYNGKIYVQGGHGGLGYCRTAFNDLYEFDYKEKTWTKIESESEKLPEVRGGHSLFGTQ